MNAPPRLNRRTLATLPASARPLIDPAAVGTGIVHLGIGAFHRAHQATYTERAIAAAGGDWGICGVTQRTRDVVDALAPQDGLYTVAIRDAGDQHAQVIGCVREVRWAREDPGGLLDRIADPAIHVITVTVSEKGYHRDPATGALRIGDSAVADDLADGGTRTVIGQLVEGLDRRRRAGGPPITVLCCDNLPDNGRMLAGLVDAFATRRPGPDADALRGFIIGAVRFPATMVDRITPATTAADRRQIAEKLGVDDHGLVVTEPFHQWVIQDDFAGPRPAWEQAGALLTGDVAPYEQIKLRMLNGSHSMLAYLALLADHAFVADAVADAGLGAAVDGLMAVDIAPTLTVPDGFDLDAYRADLLHRFANPALAHRTAQIAMDGSQKLPQRLLAPIAERRAAGDEPAFAALAVAGWMRFVSARRSDAGTSLRVEDPLADELAARLDGAQNPGQIVDTLLTVRATFTDELAADAGLRELLTEMLTRLSRDGAQRTAAAVVAEHSVRRDRS